MNHSQFEMLIKPHMSNLQSFCYKLAGNRADGEDLYQITLEKAFRNYPNSMKLKKSFLFRIAKNAWIDDYRKRRVEQTLLLDDYADPAYRYDFDIRVAFEMMAERLSARQSVLLLLIDIFGFTAKETAAYIGSTEGAVKEAIKRVRLRLERLSSELDVADQNRPRGTLKDGMTRELTELFIHAFRNQNINQIVHTYLMLRRNGMDVKKVRKNSDCIYFDFRDPNGHLIRISSKILFN